MVSNIEVISILGPQGSGKTTVFNKLKKKFPNEILFVEDTATECPIDLTNAEMLAKIPHLENIVLAWMTSTFIKNQITAFGKRLDSKNVILQDISPLAEMVYSEAINGKPSPELNNFIKWYSETVPHIMSFIIPANEKFLVADGKRDINPEFQKLIEAKYIEILSRNNIPFILLPESPTAQELIIENYINYRLEKTKKAECLYEIEVKAELSFEKYAELEEKLKQYRLLLEQEVHTIRYGPEDYRLRKEGNDFAVVIKEGNITNYVRREIRFDISKETYEDAKIKFDNEKSSFPPWIKRKKEYLFKKNGFDYTICLQHIIDFGYILEVERLSEKDDSEIHIPNIIAIMEELWVKPIDKTDFLEKTQNYIIGNRK